MPSMTQVISSQISPRVKKGVHDHQSIDQEGSGVTVSEDFDDTQIEEYQKVSYAKPPKVVKTSHSVADLQAAINKQSNTLAYTNSSRLKVVTEMSPNYNKDRHLILAQNSMTKAKSSLKQQKNAINTASARQLPALKSIFKVTGESQKTPVPVSSSKTSRNSKVMPNLKSGKISQRFKQSTANKQSPVLDTTTQTQAMVEENKVKQKSAGTVTLQKSAGSITQIKS